MYIYDYIVLYNMTVDSSLRSRSNPKSKNKAKYDTKLKNI